MIPKSRQNKSRKSKRRSIFREERYWIGLLGSYCKTLAFDLFLLIFSRALSDFICMGMDGQAADFCLYGRYSNNVAVMNGLPASALNKGIFKSSTLHTLIASSISLVLSCILAPWLSGYWDRVHPKTRQRWMLLLIAEILLRASLFILLVFLKINAIWNWIPGVLLTSPVIGNGLTAGQMLAGIAMTRAIACDFRPEHRARLFYLNFFIMQLASLSPWPSDMNPTVNYLGWAALAMVLEAIGVGLQLLFVALGKKPRIKVAKKASKRPKTISGRLSEPRQEPKRNQQSKQKEESIEMVEFFRAENIYRCYTWASREHFPDRRSQIMAIVYSGLCIMIMFGIALYAFDMQVRAQQPAFASVANSMATTQTHITVGCMGVIAFIWQTCHWCIIYWNPLPPPSPSSDADNKQATSKFFVRRCIYIVILIAVIILLIGLRFYGYSIDSFELFYVTSSLKALAYLTLAHLLTALCELVTSARISGAVGPLFFSENIFSLVSPALTLLFPQ